MKLVLMGKAFKAKIISFPCPIYTYISGALSHIAINGAIKQDWEQR